MPALMDFLDALHQGIWQVVVPKAEVTEPLEPTWKKSAINVPSPETVASYRNGQYHAHETGDDYRVHMDRYDPEKNPVMHLVDDAPLALMIFDTLETLVVSAKDPRHEDPVARLADLRLSSGVRMLLGLLVILAGFALIGMAFGRTGVLFQVGIPVLVGIVGAVTIVRGVVHRARGEHGKRDIVLGFLMVAGGVLLYLFWEWYLTLLLLILAVWFLSGAAVTLYRVLRTGGKLPQGFFFTLGMGLASLFLGYLVFADPAGLLRILVLVLGVIAVPAGGFLLVDGWGMRNAAKLIEGRAAGDAPGQGQ